MEIDYRARLYAHYVQKRGRVLAPATPDGFRPCAPYLMRVIRRHFPADRSARVLEIGCGHGTLLYFARRAGYPQLRGVDTSPEQVAAAKRLGIAGVEQGDLLQALRATASDSYDTVVAFDVLEHFTKQELLDVVDEVHRVLTAGGRWIIHTPNGESPFVGSVRYGDFTHELAFTRESMAQLLLASGFAEVRCFEDTPAVHGAPSALRWVVWKGLRALMRLYLAAETGDPGGASIFTRNFLTVAVKTPTAHSAKR